jgi:hypothetical protein
MPSFRHTAALTSAGLFALALSASTQSTAPPAASTAPPPSAAELHPSPLPRAPKAQCPDRYVKSTADRFTGETRTATDFKLAPGFAANLVAISKSGEQVMMVTFSFGFAGVANDLFQHHKVYALIDGQPVYIPQDGVGSNHAGIYAYAQLTPEAVARLGTARTIDFKIGNLERGTTDGSLQPEWVAAAHEFACKVAAKDAQR